MDIVEIEFNAIHVNACPEGVKAGYDLEKIGKNEDVRENIPAAGMRKAAAPYDLSRNIGVA